MTGPALLASVLANPDDHAPRLVYADWLDETGTDPARAEFIRAWCFLARHVWPWRTIGTWAMETTKNPDGSYWALCDDYGDNYVSPESIPKAGDRVYVTVARDPRIPTFHSKVRGALLDKVEPASADLCRALGIKYGLGPEGFLSGLGKPLLRVRFHQDDLSRTDPRELRRAQKRVDKLWWVHWQLWSAPFGKHSQTDIIWYHNAGFVESCSMPADDWVIHLDAILALHPIRRVRVTSFLTSGGWRRVRQFYQRHMIWRFDRRNEGDRGTLCALKDIDEHCFGRSIEFLPAYFGYASDEDLAEAMRLDSRRYPW